MRIKKVTHCYNFIFLLFLLCLGGCETRPVSSDGESRDSLIQADLQVIQAHEDPLVTNITESGDIFITLPNALKRGVLYNLDARVAAMEILAEQDDISLEQLRALPSLNASVSYLGRDNAGASSSRSISTGQESLEPSQSTEENRRTVELEATWNIIDAALAISDSRIAEDETDIAKSRYRKTIQNLQRDVYAAYWRAVIYQENKAEIEGLLTRVAGQLAKIQQAQREKLIDSVQASNQARNLTQQQDALLTLKRDIGQSMIELKSLISIPLDQPLILDDRELFHTVYSTILNEDIHNLEQEALTNRPEIDEEIAKKNIAWREARQEMLKTFPGMELFFSNQYDSNKFLNDPNWASYSASIMQSLTNIINAPARMRQAKNNQTLTDSRRQALILAIMAQTRLAHYRLSLAAADYNGKRLLADTVEQAAQTASEKYRVGFLSGESKLQSEIDATRARLQKAIAQANLHESYATMLVTLGRNLPMAGDAT